MTVETATGAYGKLPFHGDFVTRDLPPDFIRQWDEWLQRALQASKDAMQTHWHDTFLTSPIWRFVIAPGIVGDSCWMGCMSPSSDSVGRIFPVTFAREYPQETNPFLLAMLSEAWMQGVEKEILAIFDAEEGSVDTILDRVTALEPPTLAAPFPGAVSWASERAGVTRVLADRAAISRPTCLTRCSVINWELMPCGGAWAPRLWSRRCC